MLHWKEGTSRASGVRGYAGYVGPNGGREVGGSSVLGILAAAKRAGGGRREPFSPPLCRGARRPPSIDYTLPTRHSVLSATYEACAYMRTCVRTCVRACVRVLGRTRACQASCLRGACTGRMCARTARVDLRLCELCVCAHAWNRYMPCSFLFFSFTGALSPSFFLSLSPYRSLSVYACLSFSVLKNRRIRGTWGPLDVLPVRGACVESVINIRRPNVVWRWIPTDKGCFDALN